MLGLLLGAAAGVGAWVVTWPCFVLGTWWMGLILLAIPPWVASTPFDVAFMFSPCLLPPVICGGLGFLTQLLGPDSVTDLCSGTMGACVVCMDSIMDCVNVMTMGIMGPCADMCGGMGGMEMPAVGGEAAAGGGLMDMCTQCCGGMSPAGM
jgi:hypothetical protein